MRTAGASWTTPDDAASWMSAVRSGRWKTPRSARRRARRASACRHCRLELPGVARTAMFVGAGFFLHHVHCCALAMLNFNDLSIRRGKRVLFSGATFSLFRGEKIGITGENGSDKSSLLSLLRGEIEPESGSFDMPSQLQLAHVSQELAASDRAALEFVLDGDAELRAIERPLREAEQADDGLRLGELHGRCGAIGGDDARARGAQLLHGLGFTSADEQRPVRAFSGGWRVRLNVAQALMCRSDLLLLDEPTNHLDLDAILWLEVWLREYPGTLLLIAHDREFLDRVVNRVVNIEHGRAHAYRGTHSGFGEERGGAGA